MGTEQMPIEVNASPIWDQLSSGARAAVMLLCTYALGRGWIGNDTATLILGLAGIVFPIVQGQMKIRRRAKQLAAVAEAAPNSVAQVRS